MPYSARMQKSHLYSVHLAPRGYARMADLGMQIAQQYLSPFDKLIGLVGAPASGKSMLIKGMFPGLELVNDDEGVNTRPLPILDLDNTGFFSPHTYHVDIRFESAFTQMHQLAEAILDAIGKGKRVVVEHFDLIYPYLGRNAHLLIGIGEEVIVTRPSLFGPEPKEICDIVFNSIDIRLIAHSAEDLCDYHINKLHHLNKPYHLRYEHSDVRRGFILSFDEKPSFSPKELEAIVHEDIEKDIQISFLDDNHILIGDDPHPCTGPRMHVKSAGEIGKFMLFEEFLQEPITERFLLVGLVGDPGEKKINRLNNLVL